MLCFWASTCGGSLNMLPKSAALEKEFKNKFKAVFVVDDKDAANPVALMNKRTDLKNLGIPLMKRDTSLLKLFPHNGGPHIVFIGSDGLIKAITSGSYVNEKTVADLVSRKEIKLPVQKITLSYDDENSLFNDGLLTATNLLYNSVLTGYIEGLHTGFRAKDLPGNRMRISVDNSTILDLYIMAYQKRLHFIPVDQYKRVMLNAKDKKEFGIGIEDTTETKYKYCYELIVPKQKNKTHLFAFEYMQQDLDRYFNIKATVQKQLTKCYLLTANDSTGAVIKDTTDQYQQSWPGKIELHNYSLPLVAGAISMYCFKKEIIFGESKSQKRYSLFLKNNYTSASELKQDLNKLGFDLIPVEREIEFLVLTEK